MSSQGGSERMGKNIDFADKLFHRLVLIVAAFAYGDDHVNPVYQRVLAQALRSLGFEAILDEALEAVARDAHSSGLVAGHNLLMEQIRAAEAIGVFLEEMDAAIECAALTSGVES